MGAVLTGSKPRFQHLQTPSGQSPQYFPTDSSRSRLAAGFAKIAGSAYFDSEMVFILSNMWSLNDTLESAHHNRFSALEMMSFDDERTRNEYQLLSLRTKPNPTVPPAGLGDIQECCRLAALLYANTVFREIPPVSVCLTSLPDQLKRALMRTRLGSCWEEHAKVLLWVLYLTASVVVTRPVREWFVSLLGEVSGRLGVQDWPGHKGILEQFLWCQRVCEKPYRIMWAEMVALNKAVSL